MSRYYYCTASCRRRTWLPFYCNFTRVWIRSSFFTLFIVIFYYFYSCIRFTHCRGLAYYQQFHYQYFNLWSYSFEVYWSQPTIKDSQPTLGPWEGYAFSPFTVHIVILFRLGNLLLLIHMELNRQYMFTTDPITSNLHVP